MATKRRIGRPSLSGGTGRTKSSAFALGLQVLADLDRLVAAAALDDVGATRSSVLRALITTAARRL